MKTSTISLLTAKQISSDFHHQLSKRISGLNIKKKIKPGDLEVVIPNYNNEEILDDVLNSITGQAGWTPRIRIIDNCSTDNSWSIIKRWQTYYDGITAERLPFNTGPHHAANIILRSSNCKYVLYASGNDKYAYDSAFIEMYTILEEFEHLALVYGRNCRLGDFSEPKEFSFSIPDQEYRNLCNLSDLDCMNIATWLYTSSEPLWGMYRSFIPKVIPSQPRYGSDHPFVGLCAFSGGIYCTGKMTKEVSTETRSIVSLRESQLQEKYSEGGAIVYTPLCNCTMLSLCYTYALTIRCSFLNYKKKDELIKNSISILLMRFYRIIYQDYCTVINNNTSILSHKPILINKLETKEQMCFITTYIKPELIRMLRRIAMLKPLTSNK